MKKLYFLFGSLLIIGLGVGVYYLNSPSNSPQISEHSEFEEGEGEMSKEARIEEYFKWRFEREQDPSLGTVPHTRLLDVYKKIEAFKRTASSRTGTLSTANWRERGPYSVGGRTRAILIDKNDPTGNTVFAGGVSGGLWKTTSIGAITPNWQPIGHYFENINISAIAQDANNPDIIYFGTGESQGGGGRGLGLWKSIDGGDTWTHLTSTANFNFYYVLRILVHPVNGDIYACTESGVRRSQDGGNTWVKVLGSGVSSGSSNRITDIEYAKDGAIYVSLGHNGGGANIYRTDAGANQGNIGNWIRLTSGTTGMPGNQSRIELSVAPSNENVIYAVTAQGVDASGIYRSNNRGVSWQKTSSAPSAIGMPIFTRNQALYDLDICVSPLNENTLIIGGIDLLYSNNGGISWTQISQWYGGGGLQEVHADQHKILWDIDRPNRVLFGNDGGVWISTNNGQDIDHRNNGYNVTQFYALAIHPDKYSNYFLAGAQDNGSQRFNQFDIATTTEVAGGDGFMAHIDQNQPDTQLVCVQFGDFFLSTDGGQAFGRLFIDPDPVPPGEEDNPGIRIGNNRAGFYTPSDFDNDANALYAQAAINGNYFRWFVSEGGGFNIGDAATQQFPTPGTTVNIAGFGGTVRHVYASENVANRIWIGSTGGQIIRIDDAHLGNSVTGTNFNLPSGGTVSCIVEEDGNPNHLIATQSNYGVTSVYESINGGSNWVNIEGDLPDLPVNWVVFHPYDNDKLLLATAVGVWTTEDIDGGNTNWLPSDNFPSVIVDMLQTRPSDGLIAAGTFGRGVFTTDFLSLSVPNFKVNRVTYLDVSPVFIDYSVNSLSWLWNFGDGNTSTLRIPNHSYPSIGSYNVSLTINDTATVSDIIKVLPDRPVPYTEESAIYGGDFETNDQDFGVDTKSGTSWEKGNSTVFGKDGTASGANAWVTGLTGNFYDNNTETYLYTPNFDLTEPAIYEFKFKGKFNIQEGFDGMRVEYSLNKGLSWSILGSHNDLLPDDANRWYNYTSTSSLTAFQEGTSYFSGYQGVWKDYKTDLNALVGNENVAFRFAFRSNGTNRRAGAAIDDIEVTKYNDILETILRSFTGEFVTQNSNEITLNWSTQPEYRCSHFKISVSENGSEYSEYAVEIPGQGSTADASSYSYPVLDMIRDFYYFKIKVFNQDGTFFTSPIIVVSRNGDDLPFDISKVYPNPVSDHLGLAFTKFVDEKIVVNIYDATGRLIISEGMVPNDVYTRIETAILQAGMYVLVVQYGDEKIVRKFLKH